MQMAINWLKNKTLTNKIKRIGLLLFPIALYLVPVDELNGNHTICIFKNMTGHECSGCGMTRAILSAIHFRFDDAFSYNQFSIIVFPLLVYLWIRSIMFH